MQKELHFQLEDAVEIPKWTESYPEHKFTIAKCCFLSTRPNSHGIGISEDVLRKSAKSILGNFIVAKIDWGDFTRHTDDEVPYGYFPVEQEVEFEEKDGYLLASAYAVISKRYSKEFNSIFEFDNLRNSSVEMTVEYEDENDADAISFDIYGLTCLGKAVNGSCPDADVKLVRFTEKSANEFFKDATMEERKTYKVDKSKEAMSDAPWGDVDKTELRNKIVEAQNSKSLVSDVYMLVEDDWEEAPSEHLKYPVMCFKDDTLVYNRDGLSSALGYAKTEKEESVINKVEAIYEKLQLDKESEGETSMEMQEEKLAEVEEEKEEEKLEEQEESKEEPCEEELEEKEEKQEELEEESCEEEENIEMSIDEAKQRISELETCIEEKENIIMDKDKELEELRTFKENVEKERRDLAVEQVLSGLSKFMDKETLEECRKEGHEVEFAEIDAWANKVKASVVDKVTKAETNGEIFGFSAPVKDKKKSSDVWDRI